MINVTEKYEKTHTEYMQAFVEYHNAYLKYIHAGLVKAHRPKLRQALKKLKHLNHQLIKDLTEIQSLRVESYAELGKYEWQRNGKGKKDGQNSK